MRYAAWIGCGMFLVVLTACQPTVKVEAPDKPIEINLNVNISHEVRVKIDRDLEEMLDDENLF